MPLTGCSRRQLEGTNGLQVIYFKPRFDTKCYHCTVCDYRATSSHAGDFLKHCFNSKQNSAAHSWYFRDKFVCLETALDNPALVKNIVVPGAFSFWEIEGQPRVAYMKVGSLLPVRPALEADLFHGMKPVFFGCCEGGRGVVSAQNGLCRPVRAVPGVTARTTLFQK